MHIMESHATKDVYTESADDGEAEAQSPVLWNSDGEQVQRGQYQRYPEGYVFTASTHGTTPRSIVLLSPPHLVAVCGHNGLWFRRPRVEAVDGPAPYGVKWYRAYLLMAQLLDPFISELDPSAAAGESKAVRVDPDYLRTQYPEPPQFPRLKRGIPKGFLWLSEGEMLRVARHVPATNLLKGQLEVVVHPGGYITIPDDSILHSPPLMEDEVDWVTAEEDLIAGNASYIILPLEKSSDPIPSVDPRQNISRITRTHTSSLENSSRPRQRQDNSKERRSTPPRKDKEHTRKMSDPAISRPALARHDSVLGEKRDRSESVESEDKAESVFEQEAVEEDFGYLPIQPLAAALKRAVEKGVPSAVPDREEDFKETPHLYQPAAKGTWSFSNPDISQAAVDCFANQTGFNTESVEHPSAAQIFHIRASTQYYLNTGRLQPLMPSDWEYKDPTLEIELSYVGDEDEEDKSPAAVWIPNKDELPPPTFDFGIDQLSQHPHAPMNHGANDQRGLHGEANYFTKDSQGTIVTLDRSIAQRGKPFQLHKTWIHTGRWEQYGLDLDWNGKKSVEMLNKWRNQTLERDGWPHLRPQERKVYSDEQRTWLFKHISIANGNTPSEGYRALTKNFNEHFGLVGEASRAQAGISELCKRLIKEYEENGGKQKPVDPVQAAKRAKSATKKTINVIMMSSDEESGEESDDPVMDRLVEELGGGDLGTPEFDNETLDRFLSAFDVE